MKPINEIIADLVAKGFELPEGMRLDQGAWMMEGSETCADCWFEIADPQALDLIACEFARQAYPAKEEWNGTALEHFDDAMSEGRTEAALRALWEACCE